MTPDNFSGIGHPTCRLDCRCGPRAGVNGGEILYSGPLEGLRDVEASQTRRYLFDHGKSRTASIRTLQDWLTLRDVTRNNLNHVDVDFPLRVFTSVTGVSGSGKSTLVSQVLVELISAHLGQTITQEEDEIDDHQETKRVFTIGGKITSGGEHIGRLVVVDQKPIGRTPRSNIATYTGLFDHMARCLRQLSWRVLANMILVAFHSMSPKAVAKLAQEKASSALSCCFCRVFTAHVQHAKVHGSTPRHLKCYTAERISPMCWFSPLTRLWNIFWKMYKSEGFYGYCRRSGLDTCSSASPLPNSPAAKLNA